METNVLVFKGWQEEKWGCMDSCSILIVDRHAIGGISLCRIVPLRVLKYEHKYKQLFLMIFMIFNPVFFNSVLFIYFYNLFFIF